MFYNWKTFSWHTLSNLIFEKFSDVKPEMQHSIQLALKYSFGQNLIVLITAQIVAFMFSLMVSDGDLIIMYVSMALARFRQVNKILLDNKGSSCDRTCMTSFDYFTKDV